MAVPNQILKQLCTPSIHTGPRGQPPHPHGTRVTERAGVAGGLGLPAPEVRASIFLLTARNHSLKMLKQLGSDDPWSPCTSQSGPIEGGGGPHVRPGDQLSEPQERPLAVPTPPFPPSRSTPGPPASWLRPGSPPLRGPPDPTEGGNLQRQQPGRMPLPTGSAR